MKKYFAILLAFALICFSCSQKSSSEVLNFTAFNSSKLDLEEIVSQKHDTTFAFLYMPETKFDFGEVNKNKISEIVIDFPYFNSGLNPLIISKCDVSCRICLSAEYDKEPLMPKHSSLIKLKINTASQLGKFNKSVFVKSNASNDVVLIRITGTITE